MILKVVILAGLAILSIAGPAFPASVASEVPLDPSLESFRLPGGDYYRFPSGYLWENEQYNFSLLIPEGAEACSKNSIMNSHGQIIGPANIPCPKVLRHPAASTYAGCSRFCFSDRPISKRTLMKENCETYRIMTTSIVVDGQSFSKCWGEMSDSDGKRRYMDYFTYSEPNPGLQLHVTIFCPSTGNCNRWIHKWEKLIFDNLHIHWSDGNVSGTTGSKGDGQSK